MRRARNHLAIFLFCTVVLGTICQSHALAQINWDGGDAEWDDAQWNGGLFAEEVFGRTNGVEIGSGEVSNIVNITDGNVTYNPNESGDFRFKPAGLAEGETVRAPGGILTITNGSLSMDSDTDIDGKWTQFDGDALHLDNATFARTQSGSADSGGAFIFGSWRSYENQRIDVSLINEAKIDNHGQVWFGAWEDNAVGLNVNMEINNGSLDLKGGYDHSIGPDGADADLVFINGWQDFDAENGGAGFAKNEKYAVNFTGPGSISVSEAGIIHAVQDEFGSYNDTDITQISYQDLWNRGILQARGYSGAKGAKFEGFFSVDGAVGDDDYTLLSEFEAPVPVVWDGGDGAWNSANWNGGLTAADALGRTNGLEVGSGELGQDVHINGGLVSYDPNENGDFRFRAGGTLNLDGGSLNINTASDVDGKWSEFDGDAINISNGTLSRTQSDPSISGGAFILGSWRSYEDHQIEVNLTEGGRIENHGQLWFGAWGDNAAGLEVTVTINDGAIDLTGGNSYALIGDGAEEGGPGNADLVFINGFENDAPKGEKYVINFEGPGSITVDSAGIINPTATTNDQEDPASYGDSFAELLSYEDLWETGILQAFGSSGTDGADFAEWFTVSGSPGEDDYMLSFLGEVSMCVPGSMGDIDGSGAVEFADFLILSSNFGQAVTSHTDGDIDCDGTVAFADFLILSENFGQTVGRAAAVPEPTAGMLLGFGFIVALAMRRQR